MSSRPLAVFLDPQGAATTSPKGRVGSRLRHQPKVLIRPLPASAFSCTPLLFSHLSLSFPHIPPCLSSPSSLLLLPRLFHLLCLPGYPHSLPGWLACSQNPTTLQGPSDLPLPEKGGCLLSSLFPHSLHCLPPADPGSRPGTGPTTKRITEGAARRVGSGCFQALLSLDGAGAALTWSREQP